MSESMSDVSQRLATEFPDPEYRHSYTGDFLNTCVAAQIKALREQRGWTQAQLAERAQMKQSRISAMEDVNYSSWSIRTLARLAEAFDVALAVCFKSFSARIEDIERFSSSELLVPPYLDDLLISFEVGAPPKLNDASPLIPLRNSLIQSFAEFVSEPTPGGLVNMQRYAEQLMRLAQRIYRNTRKEYRDHVEWTAKLLNAALQIAQARVPSKEQQEQMLNRLKELEAENHRLAEEAERQIRELQAEKARIIAQFEAEKQRIEAARAADLERIKLVRRQQTAAITEVARQQNAAITEVARQTAEQMAIFNNALRVILDAERERIRGLAAATAKSDLSVEQFLRSLDHVGDAAQAMAF